MSKTRAIAGKIRIIAVSSLGGGLEMYDFVIYVFFAPVLATLFFPHEDKIASLLAVFAVFAVGYLARPIGALLFGYFGDRVGRKISLLVAIVVMALATLLIGFLPTYETIGRLAPVLLVILRIIQGIAIGGDLPGSITFVAEHATSGRRGRDTSWAFLGFILGMVLASAVGAFLSSNLSHDALYSWGWRIAFCLSIVLMFIGIYFRAHISETPVFEKLLGEYEQDSQPIRELFSSHNLAPVLIGIGLTWLFSVVMAQLFLYTPTFLHSIVRINMSTALNLNTFSMLVFACLLPLMGKLSDRVGRKKIILSASIAFLFFTYILYAMLVNDGFIGQIFALLIFDVLAAAIVGVVPVTLTELFSTQYRYTGVALTYNISFAIFAGLTPLFATYLIKVFDNSLALSYNLMFAALVTIIAASFLKDRHKEELYNAN